MISDIDEAKCDSSIVLSGYRCKISIREQPAVMDSHFISRLRQSFEVMHVAWVQDKVVLQNLLSRLWYSTQDNSAPDPFFRYQASGKTTKENAWLLTDEQK